MSLPDELLNELLSAHLDGALSDDECARVEQMIRDDQTVAGRWDELVQQQQLVRSAVFSTPPLPNGFADEVVAAAIHQAEADQLSDDHPLIQAGRASSASRSANAIGWWTKPAAAVAALAASVLFIGFVARQFDAPKDDATNVNLIADLSDETNLSSDDDKMLAPLPPTAVPENDGVPEAMVAKAESDSESTMTANPATEIAANPVESPNREPEDADVSEAGSGNTMLAEASNSEPQDSPPMEPSIVASVESLQMLMVIQVRLTEEGRRTKAFESNLETVGISEGEAHRVSQEFAAAAAEKSKPKDGNDNSGSKNRVLLVESPIKKLDLLINRLVTDRKCVQSVSFSAITASTADGAELLKPLNLNSKVDPTQVRHDGAMFPIESESQEWLESWSDDLSNQAFVPISDESEGSAVISMGKTNGPDPMSRILVLIR